MVMTQNQLKQKEQQSMKWFETIVTNFSGNMSYIQKNKIGKIVGRPQLGRLTLYYYDPKWKDQMPYYDIFPMIIPLNYYSDGFLGLNLHYLPIPARLAFFDELMHLQTKKGGFFSKLSQSIFGKGYDSRTAIGATYPILKGVDKYSPFKECIKRYLSTHIRSPFLDIEPTFWEEVVTLPVQQFRPVSPY
jgi:hypothetical protein